MMIPKYFYYLLIFAAMNAVASGAYSKTGPPYQRIAFTKQKGAGQLTTNAIQIFQRLVKERSKTDLFGSGPGNPLGITLNVIKNTLPTGGYKIENTATGHIRITAGDESGLLYGIGKLLHTSFVDSLGFSPGAWHGTSVPDKPVRGMYFSTHNHNFYQDAPIDEVKNYVEELAMWGINGLEVWFDMHNYNGIEDPDAQAMLDRLSIILKAGKAVGMKSCIIMIGNEGYNSSPVALRANPNTKRGHYHVELCPSLPAGRALILKQVNEELDAFILRNAPIDKIMLWPYDEGGCACNLCTPWGANGYLKITKEISAIIKKRLPKVNITLSTWLFDYGTEQGEWKGLAQAFKNENPWVNHILADSHGTFPEYLLKNPVPGNLPLLNFPEISMWGAWPWGIYGATPLPNRFQGLWNSVSEKVIGGYPYSEGIYEDINKVIFSQFYWDRKKTAEQTLKEYVAFEYSPEYISEVLEAIHILEKNHGMSTAKWAMVPGAPKAIVFPEQDAGAERAYHLLKEVDKRLPQNRKKAWRWRILLLRAMLDYEIRQQKGVPNAAVEAGFQEILQIFHVEKGDVRVRPPVNYGERYPIRKTANGPTSEKN